MLSFYFEGERNTQLCHNLKSFIQTTFAAASKQLAAADQLLQKSQVTLQAASRTIRSVNETSKQVLETSSNILTSNFLPDIVNLEVYTI